MPGLEFKPVVQLPDASEVEQVTGEENDEEVFTHRAKLFRWGKTNEGMNWKERGVGDAKILRDGQSGRVRFVMRRDQTGRLAANHWLRHDSEVKGLSNNDKTLSWSAFDDVDDEEAEKRIHSFCIRFKTAEIREEFETALKEALSK
ncbi:uncharacterized protein MONBRDRAFT_14213, partial [Monosiga brevicollis MX1]